MRNQIFNRAELKPLVSLLMILFTLFTVAFFKITLRRLSYSLYQANKTFDKAQDQYYSNLKIYGKLTQTHRLENLSKTSLHKKKKGQIIQVINGKALVID